MLITFVVLISANGNQADEAEAQSNKKRKVIFLTGDDLGHASGSHEFFAGAMLLKSSIAASQCKDQIECQVVNNWPSDPSLFNDADLIVHYYRGNQYHQLNKNHAYIDALAKSGVSQMFIHFGVDPDVEAEASIKTWTGAVYKTGFSENPHWNIQANLENHPINQGVPEYSQRDEWYVKMDYLSPLKLGYDSISEKGEVYSVMNDSPEKLAKQKRFKNHKLTLSDMTVFWATERKDGGRGIGVTGGHFHKNWANDGFRKQVLNAIVWGAKLPVPNEGVISPKITNESINMHLDKRKKNFKEIILKN